ncbi:MAG: putative baseplate assembly protein [Methanothrix sp.]|nr:putative baseplate assembly protein [Methanothrix sp.]
MTLPLENLDDLTFEKLVREAVSRIPVYAPAWTDHNKSDPGITFIELLAWISEMQVYRLNRVGERSLGKFLKLLGGGLPKASGRARVDVTFSLKKGRAPVYVPRGTVLLAEDADGSPLPFETQKDIFVTGASILRIFSVCGRGGKVIDNTSANLIEYVYFHAFGQSPQEGDMGIDSSPQEGDALYIGLDSSPKGQSITLAFYLRDEPPWPGADDEDFRLYSSWTLVWEVALGGGNKWLEIKVAPASDETRGLTYSGTIKLDVPDDPSIASSDLFWEISKKNLFLIRCRIRALVGVEEGEGQRVHTASPKIDQVLLNTTPALQGRTMSREVGVDPAEDGQPAMTLGLKDQPIQEVFRLTTTSNGKETEWTRVPDFDASRPQDSSYIMDTVRGKITFGDGVHGKIPTRGSSINASYCMGGGPKGNVPAHAMKVVEGELLDSVSVENIRVAEGGTAEETLEKAVSRARDDLRRGKRAVTAEDYERLAVETPGVKIKRAKAVPMYHPAHKERVFNTITVVIVPESSSPQPQPSSAILRTVHDYLDRRRLLTTEIFVYPPVYVKVSVRANVMPLAGQDPRAVLSKVEQRISEFLDPLVGGDDGKGWPFGRPVYLSEIYNLIDGVEGVDYVVGISLKEGDREWKAADVDVPARGLAYLGSSEIKAMDRSKIGEAPGVAGGV